MGTRRKKEEERIKRNFLRKYRCVSHTVVLSVSDFASLECQRRACLHINTQAYIHFVKRGKGKGREEENSKKFYALVGLEHEHYYFVGVLCALGRGKQL